MMSEYEYKQKLSDIGRRLRELREEYLFTQEEAGDYIGVGKKVILKIEQGKIDPKLKYLVGLRKLYSTDLEFIVDGKTEKKTEKSTS